MARLTCALVVLIAVGAVAWGVAGWISAGADSADVIAAPTADAESVDYVEGGGKGARKLEPTDGQINAEFVDRFERAAAAAADAGFELVITSGWRSAERQQEIVDEAVAKYGDKKVADRWVLPPTKSMHVQGLAIDVGPEEAAAWLEANGSTYGICRVYENEPWHFEPLTDPGKPCPKMLTNASEGG